MAGPSSQKLATRNRRNTSSSQDAVGAEARRWSPSFCASPSQKPSRPNLKHTTDIIVFTQLYSQHCAHTSVDTTVLTPLHWPSVVFTQLQLELDSAEQTKENSAGGSEHVHSAFTLTKVFPPLPCHSGSCMELSQKKTFTALRAQSGYGYLLLGCPLIRPHSHCALYHRQIRQGKVL